MKGLSLLHFVQRKIILFLLPWRGGVNIFSEISSNYVNNYGLQVSDDEDRLPAQLCWECAAKLTAASKLKEQAILTDKMLRDYVQENGFVSIRYTDTRTYIQTYYVVQYKLVKTTIFTTAVQCVNGCFNRIQVKGPEFDPAASKSSALKKNRKNHETSVYAADSVQIYRRK